MKTRIRRTTNSRDRLGAGNGSANRDGSVIIVVLALLMGLLFLGILLFKDSSQEEINAEYFADSAKVRNTGVAADALFDDILRQIILGANDKERHSPFYGGRNSLLPGMYGRWTTPYSGEGVRVILDAANRPVVDQNYDGIADPTGQHWGSLNNSVAAVGTDRALTTSAERLMDYPAPNVPYSYFDHTSPYLAYDGVTTNGARVIIPSYHRPQLLRSMRDASGAVIPPNKWYTDDATKGLVMRPHKKHLAILSNGQVATVSGTAIRRYISDEQTQAGVANFPFPDDPANPTANPQGVWTSSGANHAGLDENLDGVGGIPSVPGSGNDSIYLDMDLGTYTTPDGTKKYVPIVSVRMISLDALVNLNATGNLARALRSDGTVRPLPFVATNNFIHRSNQGVSRSETNPQYGLLATPPAAGDAAIKQHELYYGMSPANSRWLANMEYWWLKMGRPEYQNTRTNIQSLFPGPYGEVERMKSASADLFNPPEFPMPGTTQADDNGNLRQGGFYTDPTSSVFKNFIAVLPFGHPNDYRATGSYTDGSIPGMTKRALKVVGRHQFPFYNRYFINVPAWPWLGSPFSLFSSDSAPIPLFDEPNELRLDQPSPDDSPFTAGETLSLHMPDGDRMAVGRDGDRILQLAPYNFLKSPLATIIRRLYTTESWDALSYGKPFYDGNSTTYPYYATDPRFRSWESYNAATGTYEFPPLGTISPGADGKPGRAGIDDDGNGIIDDPSELGWPGSDDATDPFRPELRELLGHQPRKTATNSKPLMRKLSVNGVLDTSAAGVLRFRPLTPHPQTLGNLPVSPPNSTTMGTTTIAPMAPQVLPPDRPEEIDRFDKPPTMMQAEIDAIRQYRQEWLARKDRQRMARDIYVMLYMFGGGNDINYRTTSNVPTAGVDLQPGRAGIDDDGNGVIDDSSELGWPGSDDVFPVYTAAQCREMAQFAVNLVDALDPDNVITAFEYDMDLSDGWGLDDDPYTDKRLNPVTMTPEPEANRGLVFGVERQQLAFSEALAVMAKRQTGMGEIEATEFHEAGAENKHRFFTWFELQNVSPWQVNFNSNWQIRVKSGTVAAGATAKVIEKRVTLDVSSGPVTVAAASSDTESRFVIGTHSDETYMDPNVAGKIAPSYFRVDPDNTVVAADTVAMKYNKRKTLIPYSGSLALDLMRSTSLYYVNDPPASNAAQDGPRTPSTSINPSGKTLLTLGDLATGLPITDPAALDSVSDSKVKITFQLCRRQHLNRSAPTPETDSSKSKDNPWIVVDEMTDVPLRVFHLNDSATVTTTEVQTQLKLLLSNNRIQPLDGVNAPPFATIPTDATPGTPLSYRLNRLGDLNRATTEKLGTSPFTLWQPHFDRDFASATELLGVPLYAPERTTQNAFTEDANENGTIDPAEDINSNGVIDYGFGLGTGATNNSISYRGTALMRFLRPQLPGGPVTATNPNPENRWYRLFNFVEVPDPNPTSNPWYVDTLGNFGLTPPRRTPGKIDLNTMSHPALLAALLDEPSTLIMNSRGLSDLGPDNQPGRAGIDDDGNALVDDASEIGWPGSDDRNWWAEFLQARDGVDPVTSLSLPGVPGASRPFRELNYSVERRSSLEKTVLRSLPQDGDPINGRRLFELGTLGQTTNIDYTTRYRLLQKVMNNSTNRSNVFLITIKIDFFEAVEVQTDNVLADGSKEKVVRIGAKLLGNQSPGYLAHYVVDRSKALSLVQKNPTVNDLPQYNAATNRFTWSFRQDMDFSPLILHKQRIK